MEGVTPLSFLQNFLSCERNIHAGVTPLSFLQSFFPKKRRSSRDNGAARQFAFFAELSFLRKKHSRGCYSTEFFAKLFSKASIKPRQRSGATVRFLCLAFFLAKESGEGRDTSFPSPQTPLPQEPSRDCCKSLGSSLGGMRRLLCGATARPALPVVKRLRLTACLGGLSTA